MEKIERKIIIKRIISTVDSNNDGNQDTIRLSNDRDYYIPFLIKQTIDDIGIYTDYDSTKDTIEIDSGSLWNDYNDGSNDGGQDPIGGGITNPYDGGELTNSSSGNLTIEGCTNPDAINYYESANTPCNGDNSCCEFGFGGTSGGGGFNIGNQGVSFGSCHELNSGDTPQDWNNYKFVAKTIAKKWCKATYSSCGNPYPIDDTCPGNGCNSNSPCCPGPVNSHVLLGESGTGCDSGQPCAGSSCCDQEVFEGIKKVNSTYDANNGTYYHTYHFYCIPR